MKTINDKHAFACTSIEKIVIPKSVKNMDSGVFKNCLKLKEIVFENGDTTMDNDCFKGCSNMLVIKAPSGGSVEEYAKRYGIDFKLI